MINKLDYKKEIASLIKLPTKTQISKKVILLDKNKFYVKEGNPMTNIDFAYKNPVEANVKYVEKVLNYLKQKNFNTIHLGNLFWYIFACYKAEWDINGELKAKYDFHKYLNKRMIFWSMLYKLPTIQTSSENFKLFKKILSEIKGKEKIYKFGIGLNYHHFGFPEKAKNFISKDEFNGRKKYYNLQLNYGEKTYTKGKIKGRVFLNNKPLDNIKIGLLLTARKKDYLETKDKAGERDFYSSFYVGQNILFISVYLTAVVSTSKDGYFVFENIPDDLSYYLVICVDSSLLPDHKNKIKISNIPGIIKINKNKPMINLGEINIITNNDQLPNTKYQAPETND